MKAFLKSFLHAAVGGFVAGIGAHTAGASPKAVLFAGAASALTSVASLLAKSPVQEG